MAISALFVSIYPLPSQHSKFFMTRTRHSPNHAMVTALASSTSQNKQRLLAIGGSGRVGQETLRALIRISERPLHVTVAGRSQTQASLVASQLQHNTRPHVTFSPAVLDLSAKHENLLSLSAEHDVVLHMAGPFQGRRGTAATAVASAAIKTGAFYIDICDDSDCAFDIFEMSNDAERAGVLGVTSAGIYPGVSNLLAAQAVSRLQELNDYENETDMNEIDALRLFYFTAGSGGIGPTVLASTFLLLGEDAEEYGPGGVVRRLASASEPQVVDFGGLVGKRTVYALRLPEVRSLNQFVAPNATVLAKFATAPPIWNILLRAMATLTPRGLLENRDDMMAFARLSMPAVRAVDKLSGARTAIVAEAVGKQLGKARIEFEHVSLSSCVGEGTAAFVKQVLRARAMGLRDGDGGMKAGIWFPEQLNKTVRDEIIRDGTASCERLETQLVRE